MKKFILPSLILVVISFIPLLFKDPVTGMTPGYINWSDNLITFLIILLVVRRYKLVYFNGSISFGNAFKYGLKISLCYAVIASIVFLIYAKINEDSLLKEMKNAFEIIQEKQMETQGSSSASNEKIMNTMFSALSNPYIMSVMKLLGALIYGLICSLISAAILKSKTENEN